MHRRSHGGSWLRTHPHGFRSRGVPSDRLLAAAALVAWGPWRWTAAVGVLAPLLGLVLGTMSTILNWGTTAPLSHPGEPAGFAGAVIQFVGLVVALGAGIMAVTQAPRIRA